MTGDRPPTISIPRDLTERLELARRLYRDYHARCFWHCPRDLEITEELLPFVAKGLRTYGGRQGFILGSKLLSSIGTTHSAQEIDECR